jgi:glycosyltransferase involved in cell wall biosynthesis
VKPFFSIGVTTYNRRELLKEALNSILTQRFTDYEVLVGNDFVHERLDGDVMGVKDRRVHFLNHPENRGELGNMNFLLARSQGRYFTWLADDDLYSPEFLVAVHTALVKFNFPHCVFTSYASGKTFEPPDADGEWPMELYSGGEFLDLYLRRRLRAVGCYGVFEREYLSQVGGMEPLGTGFSPYSDNLLAIRAGLLENVAYVNAPLVFYRTHSASISYTSGDVAAFRGAQEDLLRKSLPVFEEEGLTDRLTTYLYSLLQWCLVDFSSVVRKAGGIGLGQSIAYARFALRHANLLRGSPEYWPGLALVGKTAARIVRDVTTAKLRRLRPGG